MFKALANSQSLAVQIELIIANYLLFDFSVCSGSVSNICNSSISKMRKIKHE